MRSRTTLMLAIAVALAGCKTAMQTPIAAMPTAVPNVMPTAVPTALTAQMVVDEMWNAFKTAVKDDRDYAMLHHSWPMTQDDYGDAPLLCEGVRFKWSYSPTRFIESIYRSMDGSGRVFSCKDGAEADKLTTYYNEHFDLRQLPPGFSPKYVVRNEALGVVVQFEAESSATAVYLMTHGVAGLDQRDDGP